MNPRNSLRLDPSYSGYMLRLKPCVCWAWSLLLLGLSSLNGWSAQEYDCADRYQIGEYGVSAQDPVVVGGGLQVPGYQPFALRKTSVLAEKAAWCQYGSAYDIFRLEKTLEGPGLLAGCYGDFNNDSKRDYALFLWNVTGAESRAFVFMAQAGTFHPIELPPVSDPYGYNDDPTYWPGPFCRQRPKDGKITPFDSEISYDVYGDVIHLGWEAYYWDPTSQHFESIMIAD